jgi:mRNA-degrading endonuclease RelE of RelBE toxin-antitoxin system
MAATVTLTSDARREFDSLPLVMKPRVAAVFERLTAWPDVSGAKPLRGDLKGNYRIRVRDYRIIFRVVGDAVTVWKIGYRGDIYD